ncbi:MAG: hypothetical protein ACREBN_12625 [Burkholderiaceae bacterium]
MSESSEDPTAWAPISARRAAHWWIDGLRFWRRAPLRLALVSLLPLVAESLAQAIPLIGVPLSKLLVPLISAAVYVALDDLHAGRTVSQQAMWSALRRTGWRQLLLLAALMMSIYATQLAAGFMVYGEPAIEVALLGNLEPHRELFDTRFVLTLVLPGLVPATLLMFALPLVVLGGMPAVRACSVSVARMVLSPAAWAVTFVITAGLFTLSLIWGKGLLLLLLLPWASATGYVAYRDAFAGFSSPQTQLLR